MKNTPLFAVLLFSVLLCGHLSAQTHSVPFDKTKFNIIRGEVLDASSGERLIGATVVVNELKSKGTVTDENGAFEMLVPLGAYSLKISLVGYQTVIKTDVIVNAGRETVLSVKLLGTTLEMQTVTVKGDYFDKSLQANTLSTVVLSAEEVRRSPGSAQDFQRILQSMPGVGFSSDQDNELLVRGGSPNENLVLFDDMELHSVNHYPNEYNSGGPINMVNVDLIDNIQFSTGGFVSKYGDKLSSVVVVNTREGRRTNALNGNANISMAGAGLIAEGGFAQGSGSWLFSLRKSYLDLIVGAIGLTAVPKYYDAQYKAVYDISPNHKVSFSGIYGNDKIDIKGDAETERAELAGTTDSIAVENVDVKKYQFATGASLKSIWTKNFFSTITLFTNAFHDDINVNNDFTKRVFSGTGTVAAKEKLGTREVFDKYTDEGETALKADVSWLAGKQYELNVGGAYRTGFYKSEVRVDGDTARYDLDGDGTFETGPVIVPPAVVMDDIKSFEHSKQYAYVNNKMKFADERLLFNAGLRYDYFSYSGKGYLSPRFAATYYLVPALTALNVSFGYFYQTHAYPQYGDRYKSGVNVHLENARAVHYIAGIEHILDEGLKLNIEGYYKEYDRIPVHTDFIHSNDRTFRSEQRLTIGRQTTYGVDAVLQQKMVSNLYGTISASYMHSRMKDPRVGYEGKEFPGSYEYPLMFTVIVGKRYSGLRDDLDAMPFYVKYASYVLPFSNDMEISVRWRYASGAPFTPRVFSRSEQHREGGMAWGRGTWVDGDDINGDRYPAYHRLDIGFNSRYNFNNWNMVVFLSVQNVYNRKNVAGYSYNSDGTKDVINQYGLLPIFGMEIEF